MKKMMKIKVLAIINPISGTGKKQKIESLLEKQLDTSRFELSICYSKYAGHCTELAKDAVKTGFHAVIAVGGDGTINEIAKALINTNVTLGIIPSGSGNGLARHLGIPMQPEKAIEWMNEAIIGEMDTISANDYQFVNVAGIGFDALVSHEFDKMNSRGVLSYIKATIKCFVSLRQQRFKIKSDNLQFSSVGMLVSFANSSQFGNDAYIAPNAKINDGKMNIALLRKPHWYQVPSLLMQIFTHKVTDSPLYTEIVSDELTIEQESVLGHIDGEPILIGKEIHLKTMPHSLKIFNSPTVN
ncbi:diacylglycerol kinase family lipid kinase [Puteibacter caeruleilacunae]|nr:diacylglycerol kinase family lipid kinase [Puteibacter caeruleilacunae]